MDVFLTRFTPVPKMTADSITSITDKITKDGSSGYKAEKGRYHLYVSHGCPFAQRVTIAVVLKGLEDVFTEDVVDPTNDGVNGWRFTPEKEGCTEDTVNGKTFLKEVYEMSHPNYTGRITVPVLFDKKTKKIVNNESLEIVRMLNTEFNEFSSSKQKSDLDLRPGSKEKEIDELMSWITPDIIRGVFTAGLAKEQEKYEEAVGKVFSSIDKLENSLSTKRYLTGDTVTEADIFLFVVLIRFDVGFYTLLKCNKKMISQYSNLWGYVRDLYQNAEFGKTVDMFHIKQILYTGTLPSRVSQHIVPVGPCLDFSEKPNRENVGL